MITIVYVPPGRNGHMIDTFFIATRNGLNAMIGLADPKLAADVPCVGDVDTEQTDGSVSPRAHRCLEYCKEQRPNGYERVMSVLGELADMHEIR